MGCRRAAKGEGAIMDAVKKEAGTIRLVVLGMNQGSKTALFCYSFLVEAFSDVVCIPITGLPLDFHKVYLLSRHETHPRIVADFIDFM